jgi:hypothetical protein
MDDDNTNYFATFYHHFRNATRLDDILVYSAIIYWDRVAIECENESISYLEYINIARITVQFILDYLIHFEHPIGLFFENLYKQAKIVSG